MELFNVWTSDNNTKRNKRTVLLKKKKFNEIMVFLYNFFLYVFIAN